MLLIAKTTLLALALSAAAAPVEKRQLGGSTGSFPSLSLPAGGGSALPTGLGGSTGSTGLGGLSSGSLGGLTGSSGSSGLTGLSGSSSGTGLSGSSGSSGSLPTTTLKKRQDLTGLTGSGTGDLGSLTTGLSGSSGSSSLGGLTSSSGSTGSLGGLDLSSLGSLTGSTGSSGSTGSLSMLTGLTGSSGSSSIPTTTSFGKRQSGSSTSSFGGLTSGLSGSSSLGGLSGLTGSTTGTSTGDLSALTGSTATTSDSTSDSSSSTTDSAATAADGSCKAISLLFARGTGEMGTMGTVIGPPLATALASAAGSDKVYSEGVEYAASAAGNANMGADGGAAMAKQAQTILSSCPDTKLVLSGYSQGAMVVHNALSAQGVDGSKVAAVVAFGDPFNGQDFEGVDAAKVKEFCGSSDFLCTAGGTSGSGSHISYGGDAEAAASFIVTAVGA